MRPTPGAAKKLHAKRQSAPSASVAARPSAMAVTRRRDCVFFTRGAAARGARDVRFARLLLTPRPSILTPRVILRLTPGSRRPIEPALQQNRRRRAVDSRLLFARFHALG